MLYLSVSHTWYMSRLHWQRVFDQEIDFQLCHGFIHSQVDCYTLYNRSIYQLASFYIIGVPLMRAAQPKTGNVTQIYLISNR